MRIKFNDAETKDGYHAMIKGELKGVEYREDAWCDKSVTGHAEKNKAVGEMISRFIQNIFIRNGIAQQ